MQDGPLHGRAARRRNRQKPGNLMSMKPAVSVSLGQYEIGSFTQLTSHAVLIVTGLSHPVGTGMQAFLKQV